MLSSLLTFATLQCFGSQSFQVCVSVLELVWQLCLRSFAVLSAAGPLGLARPNCHRTQSILQGKVAPCQKLWQVECQLQCVQSCPAVWQTGLSWECWRVETLGSPSLARPCTLADLLLKKCCAADKADLLGSSLKSLAVLEHAGLQFCNLAIQFCSSLQSSLAACGKPFLVRVLKLGRLAGCSFAALPCGLAEQPFQIGKVCNPSLQGWSFE